MHKFADRIGGADLYWMSRSAATVATDLAGHGLPQSALPGTRFVVAQPLRFFNLFRARQPVGAAIRVLRSLCPPEGCRGI